MSAVWRNVGEAILIDGEISVRVVDVKHGRARLQFETPGHASLAAPDSGHTFHSRPSEDSPWHRRMDAPPTCPS